MRLLPLISAAVLLMVFCVGLLSSCHGYDGEAERVLTEAGAVMEEHPDSALCMLEGLDGERIKGKRLRAMYGLLLTQARDKNYIDDQPDSLIRVAVAYFDNHHRGVNAHYRMLSHYYLGRLMYIASDYASGLIELRLAERMAREGEVDHRMLGLILRNISRIYRNMYSSADNLRYAELSEEEFALDGDADYVSYAMVETAEALISNKRYKEAFAKLCEAARYRDSTGVEQYEYDILVNKGRASLGMRNYEDAIANYERAFEVSPDEVDGQSVSNLINSYAKAGDLEAAELLYERYKKSMPLYTGDFKAKTGDYKAAYEQIREEYIYFDSIFYSTTVNPMKVAVNKAWENGEMAARFEIEKKSMVIYMLVCSIITIVLLSGAAYMVRANKMKLLRRMYVDDVRRLQQEVKGICEVNSALEKDAQFQLENNLGYINAMLESYYVRSDVKTSKGDVLLAREFVAKVKGDLDKGGTIYSQLNRHNKLVLDRFSNCGVVFSEREVRFFTCLVAEMSVSSIAVVLDVVPRNVYLIKNRLKNKIMKQYTERDAAVFLTYFTKAD